jgi:D-alanine-D-alanine ligase
MVMSNKKLIIILYSDARREYFPTEMQFITEKEVYTRSKTIKKNMEKMGYEVRLVPGNLEAIRKLRKIKPYIIFNLVDSVNGQEQFSTTIPAMLDLMGLPYTGVDTNGMAINVDKFITKSILEQAGIPVPGFQLFMTGDEKLNSKLAFPLIVKLNHTHGSLEINQDSVVENKIKLAQRIKYLIGKYKQSVIVEEYIRGKEVTILMIEGLKKNIILAEERLILTKKKYDLFSFEAAWGEKETYDVKPYDLSKSVEEQTKKAFKVLQFKDFARFDILIDEKGNHYFIDPNSNPSFGPKGWTFGFMLHNNNISFSSVVEMIIQNGRARF